jgi:tripartite-type tricarboxylate transporter receptor subunit TctC
MIAPHSPLASGYPSRPVTIIVPYVAGGTLDTIARRLGDVLSRRLGQPFTIENKTGGGTVIGANAVAKAPPDGYTLLMGSSTPLAINATLYKNLPYNAKTDLKLLALVAASPLVMVVSPTSSIHSLADLVREAKAKPKSLIYASAGIGSPHHLFMELLMSKTGIEMTHVPYRGTLPGLTDVISGRIPLMFTDLISGLGAMQAGSVRPIFSGTAERLSMLPDIPSAREAGLDDFNAASWLGVAAPGRTPLPIQAKLHDELIGIVQSADFKATVDKLGMTVLPSGSLEELDAFVQEEIKRWGMVVKKSGATIQ